MNILKEIGEVFLLLGMIIGTIWSGLKFNRVLARQNEVEADVKKMRDQVDNHHLDTTKHIVSGREDRILEIIKETITDALDGLGRRLDKIDSRCEARQQSCADHFTRVESRISAKSGKINGDP